MIFSLVADWGPLEQAARPVAAMTAMHTVAMRDLRMTLSLAILEKASISDSIFRKSAPKLRSNCDEALLLKSPGEDNRRLTQKWDALAKNSRKTDNKSKRRHQRSKNAGR